MFECAFIYVADGVNEEMKKVVIPCAELNLNVVGVENYDEAEIAAKEMVDKGCKAIELCAGFGYEGVARVKKAVGPDIAVGAVKFDCHPAFGYKSSDEMFQ